MPCLSVADLSVNFTNKLMEWNEKPNKEFRLDLPQIFCLIT